MGIRSKKRAKFKLNTKDIKRLQGEWKKLRRQRKEQYLVQEEEDQARFDREWAIYEKSPAYQVHLKKVAEWEKLHRAWDSKNAVAEVLRMNALKESSNTTNTVGNPADI